MMKLRRIAVVIGSDTDLPQCIDGLKYLLDAEHHSKVSVVNVFTMSVHGNRQQLFNWLYQLTQAEDEDRVDGIVMGAGWAAHLPGMCDAYLRYERLNTDILIIGVAFEDPNNERHTLAAELSISEVPGTQVVHGFIGAEGFLRACQFAVMGEWPAIKLPPYRDPVQRSVYGALVEAQRIKENRS